MERDLAALKRAPKITKNGRSFLNGVEMNLYGVHAIGIRVIEGLLKVSRSERLTAEQVLAHPWMATA